MRMANLLIVYFMKMIEIILLFICTFAIIVSTFKLIGLPYDPNSNSDTSTLTFGDSTYAKGLKLQLMGVFLLAFIHCMHNNFLTNMRLACREQSVSFACCWTPINYAICKFGRGDQMNGL